jgi:hypothetical protein
MEAACISEKFVPSYQTTKSNVPEDINRKSKSSSPLHFAVVFIAIVLRILFYTPI